jgi:hypothetical protein
MHALQLWQQGMLYRLMQQGNVTRHHHMTVRGLVVTQHDGPLQLKVTVLPHLDQSRGG